MNCVSLFIKCYYVILDTLKQDHLIIFNKTIIRLIKFYEMNGKSNWALLLMEIQKSEITFMIDK